MMKRTLKIAVTGAVSGAALTAALGAASGVQAADFATFTGADVLKVERTAFPGEGFNAGLAREYKAFAASEARAMYDWIDADRFAKKALAASRGEAVAPEKVADWNVPAERKGELDAARARLVTSLADGARDKAPKDAAAAQAKFDCWIEQQEENHQPADIAACRDGFYAALGRVNSAMNAAADGQRMNRTSMSDTGKTAAPAAPAATKASSIVRRTAVYFNFDSTMLTPEARAGVNGLVREFRGKENIELRVSGHADRAGPADYNKALSQKRADTVVAALKAAGLNAVRPRDVEVLARGEADPAIPTADGVRERRNRRVEITAHALDVTKIPAPAPTQSSRTAE